MHLQYDFIGPITEESIVQMRNVILSQSEPINHLQLNISSLGGNVTPSIVGYNFLKKLPFPITTHNLGEVTSAAILLYLAGNERTAEKVSKFVMHSIKCSMNGDITYSQLHECMQSINADIDNYALIVNQETGFLKGIYDIKECLKGNSITLDFKSAMQCGIITQMSE